MRGWATLFVLKKQRNSGIRIEKLEQTSFQKPMHMRTKRIMALILKKSRLSFFRRKNVALSVLTRRIISFSAAGFSAIFEKSCQKDSFFNIILNNTSVSHSVCQWGNSIRGISKLVLLSRGSTITLRPDSPRSIFREISIPLRAIVSL